MKTTLTRNLTAIALTLALVQGFQRARADETAFIKERTCHGTVAAVDEKARTVKVNGWLGSLTSRTFHLAEGGTITLALDWKAALGDLKPGMEVRVNYKDADGVHVANRIYQPQHEYSGMIRSVAPQSRELFVERNRINRKFWLPEDARFVLHNKTAKIGDLKPGQRVTLRYVERSQTPAALLVEDHTATFTGTLDAIDAEGRTVTVKHLLGRKTFNLGEGCRIVVGDSTTAQLSDLRIGQRLSISYQDVDGVLVASWLSPDKGEPAQTDLSSTIQQ